LFICTFTFCNDGRNPELIGSEGKLKTDHIWCFFPLSLFSFADLLLQVHIICLVSLTLMIPLSSDAGFA
jgi:hypothetical protein